MKALTIRQPYASLIATGAKTIETRSWSTQYRGPIAIHAGKSPRTWRELDAPSLMSERVVATAALDAFGVVNSARAWPTPLVLTEGIFLDWKIGKVPTLPLGAVVAIAELVDVVPMIEDPLAEPDGAFVWVDPDFVQVHDGPDDLSPRYSEAERTFGEFAEGRWAWLLENVHPIDPIPAKGRQGLWTVDHDLAFDLELAR